MAPGFELAKERLHNYHLKSSRMQTMTEPVAGFLMSLSQRPFHFAYKYSSLLRVLIRIEFMSGIFRTAVLHHWLRASEINAMLANLKYQHAVRTRCDLCAGEYLVRTECTSAQRQTSPANFLLIRYCADAVDTKVKFDERTFPIWLT